MNFKDIMHMSDQDLPATRHCLEVVRRNHPFHCHVPSGNKMEWVQDYNVGKFRIIIQNPNQYFNFSKHSVVMWEFESQIYKFHF